MRIESWPIGIVSFTLEPGDFVRAKSPVPLDQLGISSELCDLIGNPASGTLQASTTPFSTEPRTWPTFPTDE